ncbi:MAG: BON domain-containing protein [Nitrospirae bacterium]|nr:BON domain-containing protein [Nitrospirota bacterium]
MICYRCKNNIPKDAAKCPVCGVKAMPFVGAKACPNCGTVNPVSARYCINDGYSFDLMDREDISGEYDDELEEEIETATKKKKHGVLRFFMWIFIAIACLVGSAVVGYHIFKPQNYLLEKQAADALANAGRKEVSVRVDLSKTAKLTGTAKDMHEKTFAELIVKKIPKIIKVENNIVVSQVVPKPEELEKTINNSLNSQGFPGVVVSVNTALAASIIGTVPSEYDRNKVLSIVKANKDVKDIRDNLHVDASTAQPPAALKALSAMAHPATPPPSPEATAAAPTPAPTPSSQPSAQPPLTPNPTPNPTAEPIQKQLPPQAVVSPPSDPHTLEATINKALKGIGLTKVTAEVNEGLEVTLKGTVSSTKDKGKAFDTAKHTKGVSKIRDKVFVVEP